MASSLSIWFKIKARSSGIGSFSIDSSVKSSFSFSIGGGGWGSKKCQLCQEQAVQKWKYSTTGHVLSLTGKVVLEATVTGIMSPPTFVGRHIVFVLSVTQFVSATPLKLLNRISWNLVDSKDTTCSCAYYQEILIAWILWELCSFELRNFPNFVGVMLLWTSKFPEIYYWSSLSAQLLWNY